MVSPVIVLAPDKFKGSLSAPEVCAAMATGLRRVWPDADIRLRPMADGGDGTLDAILAGGGERGTRCVSAADGVARPAPYGVLRQAGERVAVLEIASLVGITDSHATAVPVLERTTQGIGELMLTLLDDGIRRFVIGLGGSSTNDAGAGLLCALGARMSDASGALFHARAQRLADIAVTDLSALDPRLQQCEITVLSDVDNPLTGERGATAVFGPQKGVTPDVIRGVDQAIGHFADVIEPAAGRRVREVAGAGAAGGLGFAFLILGARIERGAEVVADLIALDAALSNADWLITGEGRTDEQTLAGKAPWVAAHRARSVGVPATLIAGAVDAGSLEALSQVFDGCFALPDAPMNVEACIERAQPLLADRAQQVARLWQAARARHRA
ncbi:MAG: glycerate kinase [Pseudomonadota bacterium]|nr:glycerate kinase [Pseudomonadota bacterium]